MKILLINPNTSEFVTEGALSVARRMASPGTEIVGATGRRGAAIVSGRAENAIAAAEVLNLAAEFGQDCDAIVLAVSFDSGLHALREMVSVPVVGMSEAAMLAATMLGGKFGMVTFGNRAAPFYAEICQSYGFGGRLTEVVSLPMLTDQEVRDPLLILPRLAEAIDKSVAARGTESVILAGAIFAGITHDVAELVQVPVLNGIAESISLAEMLVKLKPRKPTSGSYQLPSAKQLSASEAALTAYFRALP
jgi:allantoin racemase